MANKFRFIDSKYGKSKKTHFQHTEDEIILTLPDEDGYIVTTNTVDDAVGIDDSGNLIAGYILKPDIGDNGGIRDEFSNDEIIRRAPYVTSNAYVGPLEWTRWEASFDSTFANLFDSTSDPADKDEWLPQCELTSKDVYVRYRFHSGDLRSPWSDTIHYVTPAYGIAPFTITVEQNINPLISTSGFRALGENVAGPINHIATTWRIKQVSDFRTIFLSEEDNINKTKIQVGKNVLEPKTEYIVEVTYHTDNEKIPVSVTRAMTFVTPNVFIDTPVLTYRGDNSTVGVVTNTVTGSKYKINNSTEPHLYTKWELYVFESARTDSKRLLYIIDDNVNKEVFDITNLAFNSDVSYQVTATYYSENYHSETSTIIFKVVPFKTPKLNVTVVNSRSEFISKLGTLYNSLGSTTYDGKTFKNKTVYKWNKTKYEVDSVVQNGILDTCYAGPIVFITSNDFLSNDEKPNFDFERIIVRCYDKYKSTEPWYAAQEEESCLIEIKKDQIRSISVAENGKHRIYYFFYPLLFATPYANKKHKLLSSELDVQVYLEHIKFNTELSKNNIVKPIAFSSWNNPIKYTYNVRSFTNNNTVGNIAFIQDKSVMDTITTPSDELPYIFRNEINNATLNISFYNGNTLVSSTNYTGLNNTNGYEITAAQHKLNYGTTYKMVQSLVVGKLKTLVGYTTNVLFKKPELEALGVEVEVTPETDEDMNIILAGVAYNYISYAPMLETTDIPLLNGRIVDYNCSPQSVRYTITKAGDNAIVYDKTFNTGSGTFSVIEMPADGYITIGIEDLELSTYKNDYNNPGDLILEYNTDYIVKIVMTAKNGLTSPALYKTFNTGDRPPVIISTPTVTATGAGSTIVITANSSAFSVSGLSDRTHKATEWLLYKNGSTTPILTKTVTDTNQLRSYTFGNLEWVSDYVVGVRYQASNGDWSEIAKSNKLTTSIDPAWRNIAPTVTATAHDTEPTINYSMSHPQAAYITSYHFTIKKGSTTVHTQNTSANTGTKSSLEYSTDYIVTGYVVFKDGSSSISKSVSVKTGGKLIKLAKENGQFIYCNAHIDLHYQVQINFVTGAVRHRVYVNTRSFLWDKLNQLSILGEIKLLNVAPKYTTRTLIGNRLIATYAGWHPWSDPVYFPEIIIENLDELDYVKFVTAGTYGTARLTAPTKSNPVALVDLVHEPGGADNRWGSWKLALK